MHKVTITKANASENREEWLAIRRRHVTATDWPKITGTSPFGTAEKVLNEKLPATPGGSSTVSLPMRVGTALEPLIIARARSWMGPGEYLSQAFITRRHLGFTPDLARIDKPSGWVVAEIKVSVREWGGKVPPEYIDQVKFQATVLGLNRVQVVHLKLSNWAEGLAMIKSGSIPMERLAVYHVQAKEDERRGIEQQAEKWWRSYIRPLIET